MSRTVTPQQSHPSNTGSMTTMKVPQDKIAQRAYEKWCKRGCQHGSDRQDWLEAEAEYCEIEEMLWHMHHPHPAAQRVAYTFDGFGRQFANWSN